MILNYIPLIGAILALLLGGFILFNKNQNKRARFTLGLIVLLNVHNLFESYLYYNNLNWPGLGLSYLHYHLIGVLFLLYTYFLFRVEVNLKLWLGLIAGYTLIRIAILIPIEEDVFESTTLTPEIIGLSVDNLISILLNIALLAIAYSKIQNIHFAIKLTQTEQVNYRWLKSLLVVSIGLYVAILISNFISYFDEDWLLYFKIESAINSIFSLALVYAGLRFPVFSIHGDFRDLAESSKKKYTKSSLTNAESSEIWEKINQVMTNEKPFLNSQYRLNDLAERTGKSVHHVSQAINENEGKSFSDFINQYRVGEAKKLLSEGRTRQVTILAVALEAGFNSKTAFYSTFKKETGQSPSEYLKKQDTSSS